VAELVDAKIELVRSVTPLQFTGSNPVLTTKKTKMKKTLLVVLLFVLFGCTEKEGQKRVGDSYIYDYNIDGCDYLGKLNGDPKNFFLSHKGNCKNPIHHR